MIQDWALSVSWLGITSSKIIGPWDDQSFGVHSTSEVPDPLVLALICGHHLNNQKSLNADQKKIRNSHVCWFFHFIHRFCPFVQGFLASSPKKKGFWRASIVNKCQLILERMNQTSSAEGCVTTWEKTEVVNRWNKLNGHGPAWMVLIKNASMCSASHL